MPGHLDRVVPKCKSKFPDLFFALNHVADRFAGAAAHGAQLDMSYVSKVLYFSSLIGKIQRRLVRILISHLDKKSLIVEQPAFGFNI